MTHKNMRQCSEIAVNKNDRWKAALKFSGRKPTAISHKWVCSHLTCTSTSVTTVTFVTFIKQWKAATEFVCLSLYCQRWMYFPLVQMLIVQAIMHLWHFYISHIYSRKITGQSFRITINCHWIWALTPNLSPSSINLIIFCAHQDLSYLSCVCHIDQAEAWRLLWSEHWHFIVRFQFLCYHVLITFVKL